MDVWFIRTNGGSAHNDPANPAAYVPGEPPDDPETEFDYREKCVAEGFVRIGWPNTGDLRAPGRGALVEEPYIWESLDEKHQDRLRDFAAIPTGDLVLIPAGGEVGECHLGRVVRRIRRGSRGRVVMRTGLSSYHFFHDLPRGEPYECAHRLDVLWDCEPDGEPAVHAFEGLKGPWRHPFQHVVEAGDAVARVAQEAGLA